eukprot:7525329-Lingulodinium_polyedra.AAC.1
MEGSHAAGARRPQAPGPRGGGTPARGARGALAGREGRNLRLARQTQRRSPPRTWGPVAASGARLRQG